MASDKKEKKKVRIKVVEESDTGSDKNIEEEPLKTDVYKESGEKIHDQKSEVEKSEAEEKEPEPKETIKKEPKPEKAEKQTNPDKIPFWVLFFAFLLGLTIGAGLIGGIFYYKSRVEKTPGKTSTSLNQYTPGPETQSSPSPPPVSIDKSEYTFQVLNGSGIAGEATKAKGLLSDSGFSNISVGNASSYGTKLTEISAKDTVPNEIIDDVKTSLKDYSLQDEVTINNDLQYDVVITLGSEKK